MPWQVFDEPSIRECLVKVFRDKVPGSKLKQRLYEYGAAYNEPVLAAYLQKYAGFAKAGEFSTQRSTLGYKHLLPYYSNNSNIQRGILRQCEQYGVDHRGQMNMTPLMGAAIAGKVELVEALLDLGANPELIDHLGNNALHWAMREAFRSSNYARGAFAGIYERIAPTHFDVMVEGRLVRIDRHLTEYFLIQTLWVLFQDCFRSSNWRGWGTAAFDTAMILEAWQHLPAGVLRPERNRRQHLSNVLSRNEVDRDYAYNRRLFKRARQGWYQLNPGLSLRKSREGETWQPLHGALNLCLVKEFAQPQHWDYIERILAMAGEPSAGVLVAGEEWLREQQAKQDCW